MNTPIRNREFLRALGLAVASIVASAVLLLPAYLSLVPVLHPEFKPYIEQQKADAIAIPGNLFRPVVFGDGGLEGSVAVISELAEIAPEDHAVLMHRRLFQANQFPFLRYHIEGRNPALRVMLFWQRADAPGVNHFAELDYSGDGPQLHNLLRNEEWRGTITELAVGFFGDLRGGTVRLEELRLEPYRADRLLETAWDEWTAFAPWNQATVHAYRGIRKSSLAYPTPSIAAITGFAMIIFMLAHIIICRRRSDAGSNLRRQRALGLASVGLIGWITLDGFWQSHVIRQAIETVYLFAGKSHSEKMLVDWDAEYYAFAETIRTKHLPIGQQVLPMLAAESVPKAFGFRMEYHLLPEHDARIHGFSYPPHGSDLLRQADARSIKRAAMSQYFILLTSKVDNASGMDFRSLTGQELPEGFTPVFANEAAVLYANSKNTLRDRTRRP